jgi:hypothetical protein
VSNEKGLFFTGSLLFDRVLEPALGTRIDAEVDTSDCSLYCGSDSGSLDHSNHQDTKSTSGVLILAAFGALAVNPVTSHWTASNWLLEW